MRDGERRCPLLSYRGRGSLMGWLRTTLAQRHVDHYRRTRRRSARTRWKNLTRRRRSRRRRRRPRELSQSASGRLNRRCGERDAEERYLLAAYYLDGQTLLQIARVLGVHEATVSRKLRRATEGHPQADAQESCNAAE